MVYVAAFVTGLGVVPILRVNELNDIDAMFALTTTLPVGVSTVIPAPAERLTEVTDAPERPLYTSLKFSCTFWNAIRIGSADGSSGNVPKSIFCWLISILPYLVFIVYRQTP